MNDVRNSTGHILVDGSMFVLDWFRTPIHVVLQSLGQHFEAGDIHYLYSNPPHEALFANICARGRSDVRRRGDAKSYPDLQTVVRSNADYRQLVSKSNASWVEITSIQQLHDQLGRLLQYSYPAATNIPERRIAG